MTIDKISVSYPSLEDLMNRQPIVENRILNYIEDKPELGNSVQSTIRVHKDKYILDVELIKEECQNIN